MKKSTLLAIAALAAGIQTGFAADEVVLPGGIIPSTKENPVYYTISNMRAARMSYITGKVFTENGGEGEEIMTDEAIVNQHLNLPEYLPDENETPEIWTFPYMGLAQCENKFWTAFSAQGIDPEKGGVMDPKTTYWWFEKSTGNSVYIHNAIIDGALKNKAEKVLGRPSMSFSESAKQRYYVLPLDEDQIEALELTEDSFGTDAFALSKSATLLDKDGNPINQCLDMNNYITFNWDSGVQALDEDGEPMVTEQQKTDADGQPMTDEDGEPIMEEVPVTLKYGFAGVDLVWNPLQENGKNDNHRYNNGSLFQVKRVTDIKAVEEAIQEYDKIVKDSYRAQVVDHLEKAKVDLIARLQTLRNLPAIYGDGSELDKIITSLNNLTVDASKVSSMEDVDIEEARIDQSMEAYYLRAMAVAGNGTVIKLQQMLAMRDWSQLSEEENVGNAYLSSEGAGEVKYDGSMEEIGYKALTCLLEENLNTQADKESVNWTMEWVSGQGYRLKNGNYYIRQFGNWSGIDTEIMDAIGIDPDEFAEDDDLFKHLNSNQMSWALTEDPELAAVFTITAHTSATQEVTLSEGDAEIFATYGEELGYEDEEALFNTTNICHLQAPDPEGNATWLCRDTALQNYIVCSWNAGNRYFADSNCWKIEVIEAGEEIPDGIEEISASAKVAGIYDLQGRKVAKAGKGLYIINGVKTLVK